ncbi:hypothetical protein, partial [Photobacterium sp. 53610]|uniref:hypothetical protein n=1 Tax=Photobacterium sp. 53610 TaxID=3102789 RepID=UPI002EDB14AB
CIIVECPHRLHGQIVKELFPDSHFAHRGQGGHSIEMKNCVKHFFQSISEQLSCEPLVFSFLRRNPVQ